MENRVDELFRNKLEYYTSSPSAGTWARIETSLVKKNNPVSVWRVAAALVLMGCLLTALNWLLSDNDSRSNSSRVQKIEPKLAPKEIAMPVAKAEQKTATIEKQPNTQTQAKRMTLLAAQVNSEATVLEDQPAAEVSTVANELTVSPTAAPLVIAQIEKPIVLEITLAPVEKVVTAQAEEKNSGLKKFFIKAQELKNGESRINLADFANRLFASNHKQDQDKNNLN
ncbi:MAG: hypothetical protein IM574_12320 [Cytophagales bacterium]|jgi:hypothetical protein|nr:hypothetical protein [Cytophagales bacterium]MCA6388735.1 hypothetical protein [Cytophagales bacterium]MCA6392490.1 hypothetical protein [Cytophagales bacterium]MCA6394248.1 hypothetical protein [Cytophagales bacterium]MCA6400160.1 hypothetical protein [Cytophagales bacterium]